MINEDIYKEYFSFLLQGDKKACTRIVQRLIDDGIELKTLYLDLFQRSLYEIGELWETNQICQFRFCAQQIVNLIDTWNTKCEDCYQSRAHLRIGVLGFSAPSFSAVIPFSVHRDLCKILRQADHIIQIPDKDWKKPLFT